MKKPKLSKSELDSIRETALTKSKIEEDYLVCSRIKEVLDVKYYLVKNANTKKEFCMKVIKRDKLNEDPNYLQKVSIMRKISHPNIISIVDFYEDDVNFYVITNIVKGKELFETMKAYKNFTEKTAGIIFSQIASILFFLHNKEIFHGHLRPEIFNLEFESKNSSHKSHSDNELVFNLYAVDYGELENFNTSVFEEQKKINKTCKPYYTAPEILTKKQYSDKSDIFAAGVILYTLLCGKPPFFGADNNEIKQSICDGEWEFEGQEWKNVSSSAKELISRMLNPNPSKRISAKEILIHSWVVYSKEEEIYSRSLYSNVNDNLEEFHSRNQLQQATMTFICNQLANSSQIKELKKLFKEFDRNGDGVLSYEEFEIGYTKMYGKSMSGMELSKLINDIDKDKSGKIEYGEFIAATIEQSKVINDQNLKAAFIKFDKDGSGKLSVDELAGIVGNDMILVMDLMRQVDENNDGEVSYEEFKKLMGLLSSEKEKSDVSKSTTSLSKTGLKKQKTSKSEKSPSPKKKKKK